MGNKVGRFGVGLLVYSYLPLCEYERPERRGMDNGVTVL